MRVLRVPPSDGFGNYNSFRIIILWDLDVEEIQLNGLRFKIPDPKSEICSNTGVFEHGQVDVVNLVNALSIPGD